MLIVTLTLASGIAACAPDPGPRIGGVEDLFSSDEVASSRADCLRDRGWDVRLEDGVILAEVPQEQDVRYREDSRECLELAGVDLDEELSDSQLSTIFAWYVEIADCLTERGYSVPSRPTEQTFIDTYGTDPWIPWVELDGLQLAKSTEECPVMQRPRG